MNALFNRLSQQVSAWLGSPAATLLAIGVVALWFAVGPFYHFSNGYQILINTGTTIVTFIMVFFIQNTQNRDIAALHCKMDEILYVTKDARNDVMGVEAKTVKEIEEIRARAE